MQNRIIYKNYSKGLAKGIKIISIILLGYLAIKITDRSFKKADEKIRKQKKEKEDYYIQLEKEKIELDNANLYLKKLKDNFKNVYTDEKISVRTLGNKKIESIQDRGYLYSKLNECKANVLSYSFWSIHNYKIIIVNGDDIAYDSDSYENLVTTFEDLYYSLDTLDSKGIEAKILNMRVKDEENKKIEEERKQEDKKQRDHERELEILREKNAAERDLYEKKIKAQKEKFKTLCKVIEKSDKDISSKLNIDIDILNED